MKPIFEYLLSKSNAKHVKPQSRAKWMRFGDEETPNEYKAFVDHIIEVDAYDILDNFIYWFSGDSKLHMAYNYDCKYGQKQLFGIQFIVDINEFIIYVVPGTHSGPLYDINNIDEKKCKSIAELEDALFEFVGKIEPMKK